MCNPLPLNPSSTTLHDRGAWMQDIKITIAFSSLHASKNGEIDRGPNYHTLLIPLLPLFIGHRLNLRPRWDVEVPGYGDMGRQN